MTLQEQLQRFISLYTGAPNVGDTAVNAGECVGLIEVWTDALGLPHTWGNAKDLLADANQLFFDVIYNTPTNYPVAGDVIVWDETWGNGLGHTGIIVQANVNNCDGFEQNNPPGHAPQIVHHASYAGVKGWLHPKLSPQQPGDDVLLSQIQAIVNGQGDPHTKITNIRNVLQ